MTRGEGRAFTFRHEPKDDSRATSLILRSTVSLAGDSFGHRRWIRFRFSKRLERIPLTYATNGENKMKTTNLQFSSGVTRKETLPCLASQRRIRESTLERPDKSLAWLSKWSCANQGNAPRLRTTTAVPVAHRTRVQETIFMEVTPRSY